mmetsp:Transcript_22391/g.32717  ORF Transcript_22391/g.32717 Transcript_22391/m.32717 type:complete len:168 (-) Transcript_22391:404-907(-)
MIYQIVEKAAIPACRRSLIATRCIPSLAKRGQFQSQSFTSITYSGGQASEGQGGFYASGGARGEANEPGQAAEVHEMLALAADVQRITSTMGELETLEGLLIREDEDSEGKVTGRSIEIRGSIKKLMTSPHVVQCLNRLEVKGQPVWGLSSDERDLITLAREKVNNC